MANSLHILIKGGPEEYRDCVLLRFFLCFCSFVCCCFFVVASQYFNDAMKKLQGHIQENLLSHRSKTSLNNLWKQFNQDRNITIEHGITLSDEAIDMMTSEGTFKNKNKVFNFNEPLEMNTTMAYRVFCMPTVTFNRHASSKILNLTNCSKNSATLHLNEYKHHPPPPPPYHHHHHHLAALF